MFPSRYSLSSFEVPFSVNLSPAPQALMGLKIKVLWPFLSCWKWFSRRAYLFAGLSGVIQKV